MPVIAPAHSEPLIRRDETMRYRPFGRTGWQVSALSFGCMRLSEDQELNTSLISRAVELGVNYFESTRYYLGGTCQQKTAPGLVGKTGGVIVSGKERINPDQTAYLFRKEIERQLDILGLNHFKFFQVGWFNWGNMPHLLKQGGVLDAIRQADGLVFASPIYFCCVNGPMKTFLDRLYALFGEGRFDALRGKRMAVALTYGVPDPFASGTMVALRMFQDAARGLEMDLTGWVSACCMGPGEVEKQGPVLAAARALGRKLMVGAPSGH